MTREQLAAILYRYARYKGCNTAVSGDAGGDTVADRYGKPKGGYNDAGLEDSYFKRPWAVAPFRDGYAVSDNDVVRLVLSETIQTVNGSTEERLTVTS